MRTQLIRCAFLASFFAVYTCWATTNALVQAGFYRVVSSSLTYLVTTPASGSLNWTNACVGDPFRIEHIPSSGIMTGVWQFVAYGTSSNTQMSVPTIMPAGPVPQPDMMCLIPAGLAQIGDNFGTTGVVQVYTDAIYMDRQEVSKALWDEVRNWALTNGYTDIIAGYGGWYTYYGQDGAVNDPAHPVTRVDWYNCIKWCNARSEMEGLTPTYYIDTGHSNVYRTGNIDLSNTWVQWSANGYRLPTEAEWEKAARGGLHEQHYPWPSADLNYSNCINHLMANYTDDPFPPLSARTAPVVSYTNWANGYGLLNVAGNIAEWCWDWYADLDTNGPLFNPKGPDTGDKRAARGGAWTSYSSQLRCSLRARAHTAYEYPVIGLRTVRRL